MKTAVSVPDELFVRADELAAERGVNRSQIYALALAEYLDHHSPEDDPVTAKLNEVVDTIGMSHESGLGAVAARRLIDDGKWEW